MFEAEADGLRELAASQRIRVPLPVCSGADARSSWLVLEDLSLERRGDEVPLARQLADLHRCTRPQFGWWRDNTIGATPQCNQDTPDWPSFWRDRRLGPQLAWARAHHAPRSLLESGERLQAALPAFFAGHTPVASLLHGDLWGGNYGYVGGEPVLFDPAVYFGDRECDIAMTELFGGFTPRFHAAYREAWPLDPGYAERKILYNLYHVLNHFNLFGGGYAGQAEAMIRQLLASLR